MIGLQLCTQAMANNYGAFVSTVPKFLNVVDFAHRLVGPKPLEYLSGAMNRMSNHLIPTWNSHMPRVRFQSLSVFQNCVGVATKNEDLYSGRDFMSILEFLC